MQNNVSEKKLKFRLPLVLNLLVSRSPLNEDVFTAPQDCENRVTTPDIVHLSEQIHRLLVQPVHSSSSQGYSSLGSSGSRGSHRSNQQHLSASAASSSDSNSPVVDEAAGAFHKPVSLRKKCFCVVVFFSYITTVQPVLQSVEFNPLIAKRHIIDTREEPEYKIHSF